MTIVVNPNSNKASAYGTGATTIAVSFVTTPPTVGNAVLVSIDNRVTLIAQAVTGVSDNQGNTYAKVTQSWDGGYYHGGNPGSDTELWWCSNVTTSTGTFTVTATMGGATSTNFIAVLEVAGLAGTVDVSAIAYDPFADQTTGTVTNGSANANANDLVVASVCLNTYSPSTSPAISTASSSYTAWFNVDESTSGGTYPGGAQGSYKIVSSIETSSATWTWTPSVEWGSLIATFKGGSSSTYSGVNQLDYSVVTGSNSLTTTGGAGVGTLAVTAGNLLVAVCYSANIINATFSDSSGNPWSRYNSNFAALNGTAGLAGYWCIASTTGTPTFTLAASGLSYAIYVNQFQIVQNGALIAASGNYQASIGSGSQNATSGNVAVGTTNNLGFAFCLDKAGTLSPAPGTGPGVTMTGGIAVWQTWGAGGVAVGKPANGLSTGTGPFTFTTNNPGDAVLTLGAAFSLQPFSLYPIRRVRRQLFTTYYPV